MLAKDQESPAISQMRALFGKPPLIEGEKAEDYWKLWAAFEADIGPKRWSDWIVVNDLAHKYWELLRLRRHSPALIQGACIEALEVLLRPFIRQTTETENAASDIARFFYVGIGDTRHRAIVFVAECGITLDQIFALAMQMRGSGLSMLDRMEGNRENACRALRKEIERRSAVSENPPDRKLEDEKEEPQR